MGQPSIIFAATGTIQTYFVPATGGYLIEAGGAQAPDIANRRGDIVKGMFYLNRGDLLKIVVGCSRESGNSCPQRATCGSEGGSVVWRGAGEAPVPAKLLLAAGGGQRDDLAPQSSATCASYNAGAFQAHEPATHAGNGYVSITPLPVYPRSDNQPAPTSSHPWAAWANPGDACPQGSF